MQLAATAVAAAREYEQSAHVTSARCLLAAFQCDFGDTAAGRRELDELLSAQAHDIGVDDEAASRAVLASRSDEDLALALATLNRLRARLTRVTLLETLVRLWLAGRDPALLDEARQVAHDLEVRAPAAHVERMRRMIRWHRIVHEAPR